jgi:leader peptidase (prepilin peptidase) / N-methyltransferase
MSVLYYLLLFIFGTAIGSFLGVVVDRLASKEPIWKGRSHCDHCRHTLHFFDLIPVISFFALGRKCRYCHKLLSSFYPMIEVTTGVAFLAAGGAIYQHAGLMIDQPQYLLLLLYYFSLIGALLTIFFADLRYGIIPFKAVIFAFVITLLWSILLPYIAFSAFEIQALGIQTNILSGVLSAIGAGGFFFFLFAVTRGRGMGFGDVIYALLMGFTLGFPGVIVGLYIAFVTGAIVSILLVFLKRKKFRGGTIPFGPFLVFGTFVSLFWGTQITNLFFRYLTH